MKEKAGRGNLEIEVEELSTVKDLISLMEDKYPGLRTQLDNIMILMDGKIVLPEDKLKDNVKISFLTPIGGG